MGLLFFQRHDTHKFSYKPQVYDPDKSQDSDSEEYHLEQFAKKMKKSWKEKRPSTRDNQVKTARRSMIIGAAFVIVVFYIYYKFFMH